MFTSYYAMGSVRSLKKVAEEFKVSTNTVERASRSFHWKDRIIRLDRTANQIAVKNILGDQVKTKEHFLEVLYNALESYAKQVMEGTKTIDNIDEFDKGMKLMLLLMGEATDKVDTEFTLNVRRVVGKVTQDAEVIEIAADEVPQLEATKLPPRPIEEVKPVPGYKSLIEVDGEEMEVNLDAIKDDEDGPVEVKKPVRSSDISR